MSWEDQGRQYHGWFGHGTSGNMLDDSKADLAEVAYAAVGELPAGDRARYEGWLHRGGMDALQQAMPVWAEGADLHAEAFRTTFFGEHGSSAVAAQAQRIGTVLDAAEPGKAGSTERYAAGKDLADMVRTVTVHGMPALMSAAARTAGAVRGRLPRHARVPRAAPKPKPPEAPEAPPVVRSPPEFNTEQNVQDLAALLETEAGSDLDQAALVAVGFTVVNRMVRNGVGTLQDVWGQYKHGKVPRAPALAAARAILSGQAVNPVGRATHFYSPVASSEVPDWASKFREVHVPAVSARRYRFFVAPGNGHVR